jgi:hypothetical protein
MLSGRALIAGVIVALYATVGYTPTSLPIGQAEVVVRRSRQVGQVN